MENIDTTLAFVMQRSLDFHDIKMRIIKIRFLSLTEEIKILNHFFYLFIYLYLYLSLDLIINISKNYFNN